MRKYLVLSSLFITFTFTLFSQEDSIKYNFQTSFLVSSNNTPPYWIISNQRGKFSTKQYQSVTSGEINKQINHSKVFDYGFGLELVNRYDSKNKFWLQQGYGEIKYKFLKFTAGSKNEVFGVQDTLLTSGSFIWSENTQPIPKITLSTPGFIDVPYTKGLLEFSTLLSHGWFEKDRYVESPYLHHKNIYLLFGRKLPLEILVGFDHFAMWGGTSSDSTIGKIPSDWDAFKRVIIADSYIEVDSVERNAFGNHLGAYHLGIKYKFGNNNIFFYKQHPYEDGSGLKLKNWKDGLWGISARLNNQYIKGIIYEFINTTDQGINGNYTGEYDPDNYYNNSIYQNGWTVDRWVIGNPIIQSQQFSNTLRLFDNMLKAHFFGINGKYKSMNILLNYQVVNFYGNIYDQYDNPKNQSTYFIKTSFPLKEKLELEATFSYENGRLYGNNAGFLMTFRYYGFKHL